MTTRTYTAWTPLFTRMTGRKATTPSICYSSIDKHLLPLFSSRKMCQRWIDDDSGNDKKVFGLKPRRVKVTVEWEDTSNR